MMSGPVYYVIDGLHWLDDRSTDGFLEAFVKVLHQKFRALFTTSGRSTRLHEMLSVEETLVESGRSRDAYMGELATT